MALVHGGANGRETDGKKRGEEPRDPSSRGSDVDHEDHLLQPGTASTDARGRTLVPVIRQRPSSTWPRGLGKPS